MWTPMFGNWWANWNKYLVLKMPLLPLAFTSKNSVTWSRQSSWLRWRPPSQAGMVVMMLPISLITLIALITHPITLITCPCQFNHTAITLMTWPIDLITRPVMLTRRRMSYSHKQRMSPLITRSYKGKLCEALAHQMGGSSAVCCLI